MQLENFDTARHSRFKMSGQAPQAQECDDETLTKIRDILSDKLRIPDILRTEIEIKSFKYEFHLLYSIVGLLGVGAFGVVLEVRNKSSNEIVALKIVTRETSKQMFRLDDQTMEQQVL